MAKRSSKVNSPKSKASKNNLLKKSTVQALFYLSAILWLLYAVYIVLDMSAVKNTGMSVIAVAFFLVVNAGAMLASGIFIMKVQKWTYYFALGVAFLNVLLALTSLVDYFFVIALILDLLILLVLFGLRKSYQ